MIFVVGLIQQVKMCATSNGFPPIFMVSINLQIRKNELNIYFVQKKLFNWTRFRTMQL